MPILWLTVVLLLVAWGYVLIRYDRLTRPLWATRQAYKCLGLLTLAAYLLLTLKAVAWYTELTHLIAGCR